MSFLRVVCGILVHEGKILVGQRSEGLWEFPGGKVEPGETDAQSLERELREELGIAVRVGECVGESEGEYAGRKIRLVAYRCVADGIPLKSTAHRELRWVRPEELRLLPLMPADAPIVRAWLARTV